VTNKKVSSFSTKAHVYCSTPFFRLEDLKVWVKWLRELQLILKWRRNIQKNDNKPNDTQHSGTQYNETQRNDTRHNTEKCTVFLMLCWVSHHLNAMLSIVMLCIMSFNVTTQNDIQHHDIQHNDIQHNDNQNDELIKLRLSLCWISLCWVLFKLKVPIKLIMLIVIALNVGMLTVVCAYSWN
jgi:hypothetical protein